MRFETEAIPIQPTPIPAIPSRPPIQLMTASPWPKWFLEAVRAALPPGLLAQASDPRRMRRRGCCAAALGSSWGGTLQIRVEEGLTERFGGILDVGPVLTLVATLRAAVPWQRLRRREGSAHAGRGTDR
jgi:magnesium chelatase subunit D